MVLGAVRRDVDEQVELRITTTPDGSELRLDCVPSQTHDAHAAGVAGVLVMAVLIAITGGRGVGIPAALTMLVAGTLWADAAREMALRVLDRRLRRLTEDLGTAIWPDAPAQLLPPPPRLV
jgi:hypothetical protein